MEPAYFVSAFSAPILSILIKQCFGSDFNDVATKIQVKNIVTLLESLGVRTIICEREYVDKDYSEDYANYYVQSFKDYRGSCARLHFFTSETTQEGFASILEKTSEADLLQKSYLGFMVIKPLPFTFLGKVCIKAPFNTRISRCYQVSLFGIRLEVASVAFQEQDRVVSACATTAVWSLLHALPETHKRYIASPSTITLAAIGSPSNNINGFPNKGLNLAQITTALEKFELKQHSYPIVEFDDIEADFLCRYLRSYLESRIPVFLGVQVYKRTNPLQSGAPEYTFFGDHAIVVTGYAAEEADSFSMYIHDDRIGPFVRADLISVAGEPGRCLSTTAKAESDKPLKAFMLPGNELLVPTAALVATYPKKKIGVEPIVHTGDQLLSSFRNEYLPLLKKAGAEDIYAEVGAELYFGAELLECHDLKAGYFLTERNDTVRAILVAHLPHFLWRLRFLVQEHPIIDFLFDATDTPNGTPFISYVILENDMADYFAGGLKELARQMREVDQFDVVNEVINSDNIVSFHVDVLRKLAPAAQSYPDYLTKTFGALRSPLYLKNTKFAVFPAEIHLGDSANRFRFFAASEASSFCLVKYLNLFAGTETPFAIWVLDEEGALRLGPDTGHPNLTGANPARIAGEAYLSPCGEYIDLNASSGRYSKQYRVEQAERYLIAACTKWSEIFPALKFRTILIAKIVPVTT